MKPTIAVKDIGIYQDKPVKSVLAKTEKLEIEIITFGGIIKSLKTPDRHNVKSDIILNYKNLKDYISDDFYIGATVGRFANRIKNGRFKLEGKEHQLSKNNGENHLHGGPLGFHKQNWELRKTEILDNQIKVTLSYTSQDGEENYPGNLNTMTVFIISDDALSISFYASTDKPTIVNLTHHGYFNLSGNFQQDILDHKVSIKSDSFVETDAKSIPTGKLKTVTDTPLDLNEAKCLKDTLNLDHPVLAGPDGYDHCYVLRDNGNAPSCIIEHEKSGRKMELRTSYPGVQFYTGNFLEDSFKQRSGLCLEPQYFPDSPNNPQFPFIALTPGKDYNHHISYKFSLI